MPTVDELIQTALTDPSGAARFQAATDLGTATAGPNGAMCGLTILVTRRPDGGFAVLLKSPGEPQPFGQYTPNTVDEVVQLIASSVGLSVLPLTTDPEFAEYQRKIQEARG